MASFGHVAVGMVVGRLHGGRRNGGAPACSWGTLAAFASLAVLPDADVLGVALGASDVGAAGHRGASHSLCVAIVAGILCALLARRLGWPVLRTALAGALAVASHGILDAFGEGGRGIPLLWPLSHARFISPWRVLPDAPRGLALLSRSGLVDVCLEFLLFVPLTAFALWPMRVARPRLVVIDGGGSASQPAAAPAPQDEREPPLRSSG
jgi:inner membrane protein